MLDSQPPTNSLPQPSSSGDNLLSSSYCSAISRTIRQRWFGLPANLKNHYYDRTVFEERVPEPIADPNKRRLAKWELEEFGAMEKAYWSNECENYARHLEGDNSEHAR